MTTLITNRYNQITPTRILANGCSVSVPIYFSPTTDQSKELLNKFRDAVRAERLKKGWNDGPVTSPGGVAVQTAQKAPMTDVENELGMTEDTLRYALFGRQGIPERLFFKLCALTNTELVKRDEITETYDEWLGHLLQDKNENKRTKRTAKTSKTTDKSTATSAS